MYKEGMPLRGELEKRRDKKEETRNRLRERTAAEIGLYVERNAPEERGSIFLGHLRAALKKEPAASVLSAEQKQALIQNLEILDYEQEEGLVENIMKVLEPLLEFRTEHALEYEDREAEQIMNRENCTALNKRIFYTIDDGKLQLHLATSFQRKEEIEDMYRDALYKIVHVVKADPSITRIGGLSWLNATKTYGAMKERLGFTLFDATTEELADAQRHRESRPTKNALMTREEFLRLYEKKES